MIGKCGYLEARYTEIRVGARILHSTVFLKAMFKLHKLW